MASAPPDLVDLFALSRSGHNVIMDWMGGTGHVRNRENEAVDGPGIVVLREFSSWLASILCVQLPEMRGHGFDGLTMVKRTPCDQDDSEGTLRWMIDLWRQHADAFESGTVSAVSPYHWATCSAVRVGLAQAWGLPIGKTNLHRIHRSSFDPGVRVEDAMILQRWKRVPETPHWELYRTLIAESRDCMATSRRLFMVCFEKEILGHA